MIILLITQANKRPFRFGHIRNALCRFLFMLGFHCPSSTRSFPSPTADLSSQIALISAHYLPLLGHWSVGDVAHFIENHFSDKHIAQVKNSICPLLLLRPCISLFAEIYSTENRRKNFAVAHRRSFNPSFQDEIGSSIASARSSGEYSNATATATSGSFPTLYKCRYQLNCFYFFSLYFSNLVDQE